MVKLVLGIFFYVNNDFDIDPFMYADLMYWAVHALITNATSYSWLIETHHKNLDHCYYLYSTNTLSLLQAMPVTANLGTYHVPLF